MAKKTLRMLGAALLLVSAGNTLAASAFVVGNVTRVLVSGDDRWGGCMAALSTSPKTKLPACGATWVTFSCDGQLTDTVRAYRMLDQAQLALATGTQVLVEVEDQMLNGICVARRIDVYH